MTNLLQQHRAKRLFAQEREETVDAIAARYTPAQQPPPDIRAISAKLKEQRLSEEEPHLYAELRRIMGLPIIPRLEPEEVESVSRRWILGEAYERGTRLFREQAEAILAWETWERGFCPIGVGWGKGLIALALAEISFRQGVSKIAYFCPAQTYSGFVTHYLPWARRVIPISYPVTEIGNQTARSRASRAQRDRGLFLIPYSCLSTKDAEDILSVIQPKVLLLDEAHYCKNERSARSRRLIHYIEKTQAKVAALSGTITSKGLKDYHHIIRACLREGCPLPMSVVMAGEWGQVIDSNSEPTDGMMFNLQPIVDWARRSFDEEIPVGVTGFRKAYRLRLTSCPGVTASGDSEVSCSLVLANQPIPNRERRDGWETLSKHIDTLDKLYLTPSGDEIEHEIHAYKWRLELYSGFYNRLYWDIPEHLAHVRNISLEQARGRLQRAQEHHAVGQVYAKELRDFLKSHARLHLDTPLLVGQSMARYGAKEVTQKLYHKWSEWKKLEFDEMPERLSEAIRVCDYRVNHGVEWARSLGEQGGILWVYHQEIGLWAAELLRLALGPDRVLHCPAGEHADRLIQEPGNANKIAVASISAHGLGKNLQHYHRQLVLQWPRPADRAEQMVGRTHRTGQFADEIVVWRCDSSEFDEMLFAACVTDALYIHQTTGARQKLIYATYDQVPRMFSSEALRERGFQNKILDSAQRRVLDERFAVQETVIETR